MNYYISKVTYQGNTWGNNTLFRKTKKQKNKVKTDVKDLYSYESKYLKLLAIINKCDSLHIFGILLELNLFSTHWVHLHVILCCASNTIGQYSINGQKP